MPSSPHTEVITGCRCRHCDFERRGTWARLTPTRRCALQALDPKVPRHQTDLARAGVRWATLWTLTSGLYGVPRLVRQLQLREFTNSPPLPFFTLSQDGAELLAAVARGPAAKEVA